MIGEKKETTTNFGSDWGDSVAEISAVRRRPLAVPCTIARTNFPTFVK